MQHEAGLSRLLSPVHLRFIAGVVSADEGCTLGCTNIGCFDEAVVTLHTSGTWPAGTYSVEAMAGSLANACTFTVTAPMSDHTQIACSTAAILVTFDPYGGCSGRGDEAGGSIDVCQGVPDAFHLLVTVRGTFSQIAISVTLNGQPAGGGILAPQYHALQPNGGGCGPTCQEATGDMVVGG